MSTHRIAQINEVLRATFAQMIEREIELPRGVVVTVKRVITSRDLGVAKVWISVLPVAHQPAVFQQLLRALPELQRLVAAHVILQFMPKFRLLIDESEERAQRVTDLLDKLKDEGY